MADIYRVLCEIRDGLQDEPPGREGFQWPESILLDGAGGGDIVFPGPKPGEHWRLAQVTFAVAGAPTSIETFIGGVADVNLFDRQTGVGRTVARPPQAIPVQEGTRVTVRIVGGTNGGTATAVLWGDVERET